MKISNLNCIFMKSNLNNNNNFVNSIIILPRSSRFSDADFEKELIIISQEIG